MFVCFTFQHCLCCFLLLLTCPVQSQPVFQNSSSFCRQKMTCWQTLCQCWHVAERQIPVSQDCKWDIWSVPQSDSRTFVQNLCCTQTKIMAFFGLKQCQIFYSTVTIWDGCAVGAENLLDCWSHRPCCNVAQWHGNPTGACSRLRGSRDWSPKDRLRAPLLD